MSRPPFPPPPPEPSGRTLVGIEPPRPAVRLAPALRREESQTPPSGIDVTVPRTKAQEVAENALTAQVAELRGLMGEVIDRLTARQDKADAAIREGKVALGAMSTDVADTKAEVMLLSSTIGKAPQKIDVERASQHGNLTAAELTALEQGSGILGMIGRLVARDVRDAQEAGRIAAHAAGQAAARAVSFRASVLTVVVVLLISLGARFL